MTSNNSHFQEGVMKCESCTFSVLYGFDFIALILTDFGVFSALLYVLTENNMYAEKSLID